MNKRLKANLIGAGVSVAIIGSVFTWGIWHYRDDTTVQAETNRAVGEPADAAAAASDTNLAAYKFAWAKAPNLNGQKIVYKGAEQYLSNVPKEDRVQALASAISTHEEAVYLVERIHDRFNEMVGYDNLDRFKTEGYGHSPTAAEQTWDAYLNRLATQPETYLQLSSAVANTDAKKDFHNLAALVDIATKTHDTQALIYAHRIIHDMDYWVYNTPGSSDNHDQFGAAHVYKTAPASELEEIEAYIQAGTAASE